jgi:DNA-binding MarR family transcriptional regulator
MARGLANSARSAIEHVEPDVEMRAGPEDHSGLRLWLRLLATTNLIESRVRRLLQAKFATTLPRFDLLSQLYRVPDGLKMGELSQRMMVTGGNVTGIVDLLEREQLVSRAADPSDGRALRVRLTTAGRKAFQGMAECHERWIVESFDGVDRADLRRLTELLGRVKVAVRSAESKS